MKCADCESLFDAYLDGELSGSLRLEFDAHRLRCRRCQQTLAMMETVTQVIGCDPEPPELSFDFTDRVLATVEKRRPLSIRLRSTRVAVVAGVALQAAAVLMFATMFPFNDAVTDPVDTPPGTNIVMTDPGQYDDLGDKDARDALADHIREYAKLIEFYKADGSNPATDLRNMARYASFEVTPQVAASTREAAEFSPWRLFLEMLHPRPTAPEKEDPAPAAADVYPL
jgi:hypothetical protein